MNKPLAIFDLDYTLVDADCELVWCDTLFRLGVVDEDFMRRIHKFDEDYAAGHMDYPAFEECLLSPLAGIPVSRIDELMQDFLVDIRPFVRQWMMSRVNDHLQEGHEVLLATASNNFIAGRMAELLNISNLVCTQVKHVDGRPTGQILGQAAYREGKVTAVLDWVSKHGGTLEGSWAYSDSNNDIAILESAAHPVAVTPDALLRAHAVKRGWRILESPDATAQEAETLA